MHEAAAQRPSDTGTDQATEGRVLTFAPGAIIAREGERVATRFEIVAGVAETSLGVHLLGRLGAGDRVPPGDSRVAEATVRAITVVRARALDRGR